MVGQCRRWQIHPNQPAVSQVSDSLHSLYESRLSSNAISTNQSTLSAIVQILKLPLTGEALVSVSIYVMNLSLETTLS